MAKKKKVGPLAKALLETAGDMRKAGLMDKATHEKITLRHLGRTGAPKAPPIVRRSWISRRMHETGSEADGIAATRWV